MAMKKLDPLDLYDITSELSEEELMVRDSVGRMVDEKVIPLMREAFEQHEFPRELIPEVAELGLLGSSIDGYDCAGLNSVSYGLICQELERGDSGLRSFVSVQSSLVMFPIHAYGSEEQKQRWLPAMARGEAIGCFGLTEPPCGSVRPKQPMASPPAIAGSQRCFCSSEPYAWIGNMTRLDCTETKLRRPESPRSSSWQIRPYETLLRPAQS